MRYLFDSDPEKPKTEIAMHYIREEVIAGRFLAGVWRCNLGLPASQPKMAAGAGSDWVLIDQEHGPGDSMTLLHQIQAMVGQPCAPIACKLG
jgi:4-hydroxy-2-oxoheptanedioate aldolase